MGFSYICYYTVLFSFYYKLKQICLFFFQNIKDWEPKRIGALVLYIFVVTFACRGVYVTIQAPFLSRQKKELTEAYMEALIPEPSPTNIKR